MAWSLQLLPSLGQSFRFKLLHVTSKKKKELGHRNTVCADPSAWRFQNNHEPQADDWVQHGTINDNMHRLSSERRLGIRANTHRPAAAQERTYEVLNRATLTASWESRITPCGVGMLFFAYSMLNICSNSLLLLPCTCQ